MPPQQGARGGGKVVVVDNASPNGTGAVLAQLYATTPHVHVLLNKRNLGFARGNNVGFVYAKRQLHADFIVMTNNDTVMLHDSLQQMVVDEYNASGCAVIGPQIITPHPPYDSNPGPRQLPTLRRCLWHQVYMGAYWLLSFVDLDRWAVRRFDKSQQRRAAAAKPAAARCEGVQLHGSCLVFTPAYIGRFDGLDSRTFMYGEEELLFLRCLSAGLTTVYLPTIHIFHKEDSATATLLFNKPTMRRRFGYGNALRSKWVLIFELISQRLRRTVSGHVSRPAEGRTDVSTG